MVNELRKWREECIAVNLSHFTWLAVSDSVYASVTDTGSAQGPLAVSGCASVLLAVSGCAYGPLAVGLRLCSCPNGSLQLCSWPTDSRSQAVLLSTGRHRFFFWPTGGLRLYSCPTGGLGLCSWPTGSLPSVCHCLCSSSSSVLVTDSAPKPSFLSCTYFLAVCGCFSTFSGRTSCQLSVNSSMLIIKYFNTVLHVTESCQKKI